MSYEDKLKQIQKEHGKEYRKKYYQDHLEYFAEYRKNYVLSEEQKANKRQKEHERYFNNPEYRERHLAKDRIRYRNKKLSKLLTTLLVWKITQ